VNRTRSASLTAGPFSLPLALFALASRKKGHPFLKAPTKAAPLDFLVLKLAAVTDSFDALLFLRTPRHPLARRNLPNHSHTSLSQRLRLSDQGRHLSVADLEVSFCGKAHIKIKGLFL
jgi:hypothetical protein